jgi:hypothetical protein
MKRTRQIWGCVAVSFIVAFSAMPIKAQQRTANPGKPLSPKKVFKDEYSEFDSDEAPEPTGQELVKLKLEHARQWYINGLSLIERKDTTHAAEYFEEAMLVLNELVSYPGIEKNEDFLDLAQSIIEDYEGFVDEIDNLPSASAAFVLREKLFQEVDAYARNNDNKINIIPTDTVGKTYVRSIPGTTVPITINDAVEKSVAFLTQNKGRKALSLFCIKKKGGVSTVDGMTTTMSMPMSASESRTLAGRIAMNEFYTVKDVAKIFRVQREETIRRWIRRGLSFRMRFARTAISSPQRDIDAFIKAKGIRK